jgi:hypothetical protein
MKAGLSGLAVAACLAFAMATASPAAERFVSIGTGGITGVYFQLGGAICRVINRDSEANGTRCAAEPTGGSLDNIDRIGAGELEFGVAQADAVDEAHRGTGPFASRGAVTKLRTLFSVHAETATILVRGDAGIETMADLRGRRVNIGNPGGGQRLTWEAVAAALGWTEADLENATELKSAETGLAICEGRIDALLWVAGHPSALTRETLADCDVRLLPVNGPEIGALVAERPVFRPATIPAGLYGDNPAVGTFAVTATVVTSATLPEEVAYSAVKAVFDNLDEIREAHPAFSTLAAETMISGGLSAPLHPGAERYYRERGWM